MKKLAVVFGGDSLEHDISIITGLFVAEELEKNNIDYIPLYLSRDNTFYTGDNLLNKNNYENKKGFIKGTFVYKGGFYQFKYRHKYVDIECAILCVHGANAEDGTLKAFFNLMKIPSTSSSVLNSAIIQDKHISKILMKNSGIPVVDSFRLNKNDRWELPDNFSFPLVIKPIHLGSSIGVKKVENNQEFLEHLNVAFNYDESVIVEKAVENLKELNIAILGNSDSFQLSEIELVNVKNKVLSFSDKYELFQSKYEGHVVPAKIPNIIEEQLKEYATKAFKLFDCQGVVRFDFLFDSKSKQVYLNEINSIPGSLAFYLFKNLDISFMDILNTMITVANEEYSKKRHLITTYEYSNLKKLANKK